MTGPIYLDHHATTPVDARVLEAMLPFFTAQFGNASSKSHGLGWDASDAVTAARAAVAQLLDAEAREIVFTSGATEADNLALFGLARARADRGRHVVVSALEHKAVLDAAHALTREGFTVTEVAPGPDGRTGADEVAAALRDDTVVVSVMLANNEIGVVNDVGAIGALLAERDIAFHIDATQGLGQIPFSVADAHATTAALSAHKLYGPKGVGALYVRRRPKTALSPLFFGGGHERGLRSGTLNVPGIVGLGVAAQLARDEGAVHAARMAQLRDRLLTHLERALDDVVVHGSRTHRLPQNLNVGLPGVEAEALLLRTHQEVAMSSGSACTSSSLAPSHVLRGIKVPHDLAHCSIRMGLGWSTTEADVDRAATVIVAAAKAVRAGDPPPGPRR